jgi:hypothetical protein
MSELKRQYNRSYSILGVKIPSDGSLPSVESVPVYTRGSLDTNLYHVVDCKTYGAHASCPGYFTVDAALATGYYFVTFAYFYKRLEGETILSRDIIVLRRSYVSQDMLAGLNWAQVNMAWKHVSENRSRFEPPIRFYPPLGH